MSTVQCVRLGGGVVHPLIGRYIVFRIWEKTLRLRSHKLLKLVISSREITLHDLEPFIEKKFGDYRDYFPLASLITNGFVSSGLRNSEGKLHEEKLLASILYAKATGEEKVNNYTNTSGKSNCIFTMTAKTELYFDELTAKRTERFFTALISIIVGVTSALITLGLKSQI
ncbi:hypothetical protein FL840_23080 [Vibrio parahaemolyticus]|nr:hypothetical protein [Vibrio parahaemolyticus]